MTEQIRKIKLLDVKCDNIKVRPAKAGTKYRYISYEYDPLVISFPKVRIPFDSKINMYGQSEISMSFDSLTEKKNKAIIDKIKELDNYFQELAKKHNWLDNKPLKYIPILKVPLNPIYSPTIKTKISKSDKGEEYSSKFFDAKGKKIVWSSEQEILELLPRNTFILPEMSIVCVWFNNTQWGVSIKLSTAKIYQAEKEEQPEPEPIDDSIDFLDSDDNESDSDLGLQGSDSEPETSI